MGTYLNRVAQRIVLPAVCSYLTMPDPEVIGLLALGRTINPVAAAESIKVRTVRTHRVNIIRKLNLHTLAELFEFTISSQIIFIHSIPIIQVA